MSLNSIWQKRADARKTKTPIVHWRVTEWEDIGGNKHREKPAVPACKLSGWPIAKVTQMLMTYNAATIRFKLKDLLTCEACRIMYEEMVEPDAKPGFVFNMTSGAVFIK